MKTIMFWHRAYFFVVLWFTSWVGFFGFFRPQEILRALPWPVPPLHARFIGALYLSASLFLILSMFARRLAQVRTIVIMALVWTGWLLLVSALHWRSFDLAREQVWFWIVAYVAFPIVAFWLAVKTPSQAAPSGARIQQRWVVVFFALQGVFFVALSMLCFFFPERLIAIWPWKISSFLAQVYSGPLLAYGVGGLMQAQRRNWSEAQFPTLGLLTGSMLALIASALHLNLFTPNSPSALVWFGSLIFLSLATALIVIRGARHA